MKRKNSEEIRKYLEKYSRFLETDQKPLKPFTEEIPPKIPQQQSLQNNIFDRNQGITDVLIKENSNNLKIL